MKHTLKKSLAIILAAATILCCAPLIGLVGLEFPKLSELFASEAKAVEASDLPQHFDLNYYNVSTIFRDIECNPYNDFLRERKQWSPAKGLYNDLSKDVVFSNSVKAWEAVRIVANPSNLVEHLDFQQQYEKAIFSVLFSALGNDKYEELEYNKILSKTIGLTDNLLSIDKTAKILSKTNLTLNDKDELKDTAFAFLTNGKDIESKWSAFGDYTGMVNKYSSIVDKAFEIGAEAVNIINSASMYVSLLDSGVEVLDYLNDLKSESPNAVFSAAVSTVIRTISQDWLGIVEKVIFDSGFVIGKDITKELTEYAWEICCSSCPFLLGMTIGEQFGTWACNVLFETEDTIKQYEYLKILVQIDEAATKLFEKYGDSCKSSLNSVNAAQLMFATDFSWVAYCLGADASVEFADITQNKGLANKIESIIDPSSKQTFIEYEEGIYKLVNICETSYIQMKSYWKEWIEEDYPEFAKKVDGKPEPISSINISKDEVIVRVGELMSIPYTVGPENHSGMYGLKSDNETVIRSSEPMNILSYAKEENIGTSNVTIYSIDNPSICDSVKLTVIGKDDEGVSEYESNIVTGTCGDNLTWTLNKNTGRLVIGGTGDMENYDFPKNSPWYSECSIIKSVTIGNGVTSICAYAFQECDNLTKAIIGENVTSIGVMAFFRCYSLTEVIIGKKVTSIDDYAFWVCDSLVNITIPDSVTNIGAGAFNQCENLKNIRIGKNVVSIGIGAFNECYNLTDVIIPDSVKTIENDAFSGCKSISNITLGSGVISIGRYAFRNCDSVTSVIIPDSVNSIGEEAFVDCDNLTSLKIGNGLTTISESVFFGCENLMSVTIGDKVTTISSMAFSGCKSLKNIELPNDLLYIGRYAFSSCVTLDNIEIDAVTVDEYAFEDCTNLKSVIIGKKVESIGRQAFADCDALTSILIPDNVTNINASAFLHCDNLLNVLIDSKVIGDGAFSQCHNIETVEIGDNVTGIGRNAFGDCTNLKNLTIGSNVIDIGECAFKNCSSLTSVIINNRTIGSRMFYNCDGLESIKIPDNVKYIGDYAFWDCDSLLYITIPDSVTSVGDCAFGSCDALASAIMGKGLINISTSTFTGCKCLKNLTIGDGTTSIGVGACYGCSSLTSVIIPNTVTIIGDSAFAYCKSLTDVYYMGTEEEWDKIEIGNYNHYLLNATIHYNGETTTNPNDPDDEPTEPPVDSDSYTEGYYTYTVDSNGNATITAVDTSISGDITVPLSLGGYPVTSIGEWSFWPCQALTSITIPDSITSIGDYAFNECVNLTSITIGKGVTSIGEGAFSACFNITDVYYTGTKEEWSAIEIGESNGHLANVTIHYNCAKDDEPITPPVDSITYTEGYYTYSIDSNGNAVITDVDTSISGDITIPSTLGGYTVVEIGASAFDYCENITSVIIPKSITSIANSPFYWCLGLSRIIVDSLNSAYCSDEYGVLYNKDKTKLIQYPAKNINNYYKIPETITDIGNSAFFACANLTDITIPDSVSVIGSGAFAECRSLKNFVIPYGIITIKNGMFNNCISLSSITIPDSVMEIKYASFSGCSSLTDVYYCGSAEEWNAITVEEYNEKLTDTTVHFDFDPNVHIHSYVSFTIIPETCVTNGTTIYTCILCGNNYTEVIPLTGHNSFEWMITENATCTQSGEKVKKCVKCDEVFETSIIPAKGHNQGAWLVSIEPTCTEEGKKIAHCLSCGIIVANETVPATGHTAGDWEVVTNSSCTSVGKKVKKCVVCGEILETEEIAMTEHVAGSWITVLEPTTEAEGKKVKKCTACGLSLEEVAIEKLPKEPVKDSAVVKNPSTSTISYGDAIILHIDESMIPVGGRVEWTASNGNFSYKANGATCTISPEKSGDTVFTATIYDANGNAVSTDEQTMTSKAGFFDKIIAFFKKLFGLTKTYPDIFGI